MRSIRCDCLGDGPSVTDDVMRAHVYAAHDLGEPPTPEQLRALLAYVVNGVHAIYRERAARDEVDARLRVDTIRR